jgi:NTE family protein
VISLLSGILIFFSRNLGSKTLSRCERDRHYRRCMGDSCRLVWSSPIRYLVPIVLLPWAAGAQPATTERPRIGLALEGGGALGLAHIGVLQWLEEHRIPVDYIAGTSMGGLVGGIYATGMDAAEIHQLVSKIDWHETIAGQIPFQALSYRRKQDQRAFQNGIELGLHKGLSLPSGLTSDKNITFLLDRQTLPYSDLKSFDDLPVPFRSVATDLTSGKPVVFRNGPLGEALRATMSLPAVFPPVRRDGTMYADGGLLDNLPVDLVKQMGADIVIAVNLSEAPFRPQDRQSMVSILQRSVSVMITVNELRSMERADLVISVDLHDYKSSDYAEGEKIIARGHEGTARKSSLLGRLSLDEPAWLAYEAARESRRIQAVPTPEFVRVTGIDDRLSHAIENSLAPNVGKPVDPDRLEQDINLISGDGRFYGFSYGLTQQDGREGLLLRGNEKEYVPPLFNIGFLIDGSDLDNVRGAVNARITVLDAGGVRSEWRTDLSAGSVWGAATEYYRPLTSASKWFVAPRISGTSSPFDLYNHTTRLAEYRIRQAGGGIDIGYAFDRFSEIRVGYDAGYLQTSLTIGDPVLPTPSGMTRNVSIRYDLDRLDNPVVPRRGQILRWRAQWDQASPGASRGFPLAELSFGLVHPVSKPASVYLQGFAGSTFGYEATGLPQFFLGGAGRLNAYGTNELRTDQYWLARLGYLHELFRLPPILGNRVYATAALEMADAYNAPGASRLPADGSGGFVMETLFGPLFLGGSFGDSGHRKVYFLLGKFF